MNAPVAIQWRALATAASLTPIQIGTLSSHDFAKDQQRLVQVSSTRHVADVVNYSKHVKAQSTMITRNRLVE